MVWILQGGYEDQLRSVYTHVPCAGTVWHPAEHRTGLGGKSDFSPCWSKLGYHPVSPELTPGLKPQSLCRYRNCTDLLTQFIISSPLPKIGFSKRSLIHESSQQIFELARRADRDTNIQGAKMHQIFYLWIPGSDRNCSRRMSRMLKSSLVRRTPGFWML